MIHIKAYEEGDLCLPELQEYLMGIGESESLQIGSNRLCFYLQLETEGETFDYTQPLFAEWENPLSF